MRTTGTLAVALAGLLALGGGGCASGEAEAESGVAAPVTTIALSASAAAGALATTVAEQHADDAAFARKRARLVTELGETVGEADEQIEMIEDMIAQREACRDPDDEDERITAIYTRMDQIRSALRARRAHAGEALARLWIASADDWAMRSWAARMAVDDLETTTETSGAKMH